MHHSAKITAIWKNIGFAVIPLLLMVTCIFASLSYPGTRASQIRKINEHENSSLGGGHPVDGVNYRRNNRSPYLLPLTLALSEHVIIFEEEFNGSKEINDFMLNRQEDLFIGYMDSYGQTVLDGYSGNTEHKLTLLSFGGTVKEGHPGGKDILLTANSIYTTSLSRSENTLNAGFYHSNKSQWTYKIIRYERWPNIYSEMKRHGYKSDSYHQGHIGFRPPAVDEGDNKKWRNARIFPLPDGHLLVSVTTDKYSARVIKLSNDLKETATECLLKFPVRGFTLNEQNGKVYVLTSIGNEISSEGCLYCLNQDLDIEWSTQDSWGSFGLSAPVVDNKAGILGCSHGAIRHINSNGSNAIEKICGAQTQPAILNDGTIAVICDSQIKFFNTNLRLLREAELPGGPGSGVNYNEPPLVDAHDNMAIFTGQNLYVINRDGNTLTKRSFDGDIRKIRLGPEHLFVALDYAIYRFPN